MTKTSTFLGVTAGILVFFLAGCLNPITIAPPGDSPPAGTPAGVQEIPDGDQPFTLTLAITGKDGAGSTDRSIAGLRYNDIKLSGTGVRNYMQLIVTNASGVIVSYSESRQESYVSTMGTLTTEPLDIANTYNFLFLMGHWEKEYTSDPTDGTYKTYSAADSPLTLMAAGYLDDIQIEAGENEITITLYPITVDVKLETRAEPTVTCETDMSTTSGAPVLLKIPGPRTQWRIICEILKDVQAEGLELLLQSEGKASTDSLSTTASAKIVNGSSSILPNNYQGGSTFSFDWTLSNPASPADLAAGSFNFNLDVYPFGKNTQSAWSAVLGNGTYSITAPPKWIIRNGVNNKAPDGQTNYRPRSLTGSPSDTPWSATKNGNGAIAYQVTPDVAAAAALQLANGEFKSENSSAHTAEVTFTPSGTMLSTATLYYAITDLLTDSEGDLVLPPAPAYSAYVAAVSAASFIAGSENTVTLDESQFSFGGGDICVWLLLYKDGYVSNALPIPSGTVSLVPEL
jgi:hypothetical protein